MLQDSWVGRVASGVPEQEVHAIHVAAKRSEHEARRPMPRARCWRCARRDEKPADLRVARGRRTVQPLTLCLRRPARPELSEARGEDSRRPLL